MNRSVPASWFFVFAAWLFALGLPVLVGTPASAQAALTTLYSFSAVSGSSMPPYENSDGAYPSAGLVQASDGNFYGTTYFGGSSGDGTVFKMTVSGGLTTLHAFSAVTTTYPYMNSDGAYPDAALIQGSDGNFYGTTTSGGPSGNGTIFKITPSGTLTTLHGFSATDENDDNSDGAYPDAALIQGSDGNFYGTTTSGGPSGNGTIFKITPSGTLTTLHSFSATDGNDDNSDGAEPAVALIQGNDGNVYGTTSYGGSAGGGTIFKMTLSGTLTTLVNFIGDTGLNSDPNLLQGVDGNFYGTTANDGSDYYGTVFKMTPSGTLTTLYSFTGDIDTDGGFPNGLTQGRDGNFYGTTVENPDFGDEYGKIFKMTPSGALTTLVNFNEDNGDYPNGIIQGNDGSFYGTTSQSGLNRSGTIFRISELGILDANYQFTHVDLSDDKLRNIGSSEIAKLALDTHTCVAAVADGATKLLLKYVAPSAGTVNFTETNGYPGDLLETVNGSGLPTNVPTQLVNGEYVAFALYKTPDALPSVSAGTDNPASFEADFAPAGGTFGPYATAPLALQEPPVLLVHGFNSDPTVWENATGVKSELRNAGYIADQIREVDWSSSNFQTFAANQYVLFSNPGGINETLKNYRDKNIAVTKVDVVGHSMGGILTREFAMTLNYKCLGNFEKGYIRRMVTIGTPHTGTPYADTVVSAIGGPIGPIIVAGLQSLNLPYGGAISDLQYESPAIRNITATPIPCFAWDGVSDFPPSDTFKNTAEIIGSYALLTYLTRPIPQVPYLVFSGHDNDCIVATASESGGLTSPYTLSTIIGTDHLGETASNEIGRDVAARLAGLDSGFDMNGFPAPASLAQAEIKKPAPMLKPHVQQTAPFLTVTAPATGQVFAPGATVTVTLTPNVGTTLSSATIIVGPPTQLFGTQTITASPFTITFTVPMTYVGDIPITVIAADTANDVCLVTSGCAAQTSATVTSLTATAPTAAFSSLTATAQLVVTGTFSDGVDRDITSGATGTTYQSTDDTIVSVSADGLVSAVGNGSAQVTVTNGSGTATVPFTVSIAAPAVLMVSPAAGTRSAVISVSLAGYNFTGATGLGFDVNGTPDPNVNAASITVDGSGAHLTAVVTVGSAALLGLHTVVVTTGAGSSDPLAAPDAAGFTVSSSVPSITGFAPTSGPVGTTVTLTGTGFATATAAAVNGVSAAFGIVSDTSMTVTVPTGATTGKIGVTNPSGTGMSATPFTVSTSAPTITSISPTSGTAGTVITITGTGLTGATSVTVNGVSVPFTVVNGTTITFTIPAGLAGGIVTVTTPAGSVSATVSLTVLTWNSKNVAAAPDGTARMLWTRSDGAAGIWIMNAANLQTSFGPTYGPFPGWSAKAVSVAGNGTSRVLWTNTNGQAGVWSFNAQGTKTTVGSTYGPYAGWTAADIATAPNGTSRVLWTNTNGMAGVWTFSASDIETTIGTTYGPFSGWTAKAVGAASDGTARVLWTNTNGQAGVWSFNAADIETVIGPTYGPYTGWSAKDLGTSSDGTSNVLWTNVSGAAGVWTFSAADIKTTIGPTYGPYPGYTAASLDAANDQSRVLWINSSRAAGLWTFGANDAESVIGSVYGPF